jgi:hypothetical protein
LGKAWLIARRQHELLAGGRLFLWTHSAQDMEYYSCCDTVCAPVTQWGVQAFQSGLVKERHDKEKGAQERKTRTNQLEDSGPKKFSIREISCDAEICQTRQQNKNVPGTIQQSCPIRDADHVMEILVHKLTCKQENNQDKDSES